MDLPPKVSKAKFVSDAFMTNKHKRNRKQRKTPHSIRFARIEHRGAFECVRIPGLFL